MPERELTLISAGESSIRPFDVSRLSRYAAKWFLLLPVLLVLAVFFVAPLIINLERSLHPTGTTVLTTASYQRILGDPYVLKVGLQTLLLASGATLTCLVFGYPFAYAVARSRGIAKALLIFALVAPLLVNVVVRSYGWMVVLGSGGLLDSAARVLGLPGINVMYSWTAILIALVHVLLPFMVLSIASTLESLDLSVEDAAAVLGASPMRTFWHITFPMSIEGVVTGCVITFSLSIGSFVTVMLLGDNSTMVLPLLAYQRLTTVNDWPGAATLGIALFAMVMILLALQASLRRFIGWRAA